jgi:hypothetical protein
MFIQAVGFATPMGTGVITSTLAGNGIRIGSTTTATANDKPGNPSIALGPAGGGAQLSDPARTGPKIAAKPARRWCVPSANVVSDSSELHHICNSHC